MITSNLQYSNYSYQLYAKDIDLHYDGISISKGLFYNNTIKLTTDSIAYYAKKILNKIETENGLPQLYDNNSIYNWNKETKDINLNIYMVNGKKLSDVRR
ncbi:hypothetical protein [Olleya sp. Bg11-27]|uniref:hypothetical protein n=1 Tax=Olleya sp. Bg11-27 TaxID=2058135 RepID=UPI000C30D578|nr:hypothetical protein [Olleya sp. Bg11-27]AUC76392.1 hypothetical protein CW732_12240 [Olleya sp. Bg11-27]